jgi:Trk-type K+ transport system membrane component
MEFDLEFIVRAAIIMLLISAISFPFHVKFRKLSLRETMTDPVFWTMTLSVSIVVALLASLSDS